MGIKKKKVYKFNGNTKTLKEEKLMKYINSNTYFSGSVEFDKSSTVNKLKMSRLRKKDINWSSPQKVVHLLVWEINPIRNMKGGLKWLRKDTNPKKS